MYEIITLAHTVSTTVSGCVPHIINRDELLLYASFYQVLLQLRRADIVLKCELLGEMLT